VIAPAVVALNAFTGCEPVPNADQILHYDVRARMGKAGHETDRNWVSADHDNRDRTGRLFGSEARRRAPGNDGVGRQANQLGG